MKKISLSIGLFLLASTSFAESNVTAGFSVGTAEQESTFDSSSTTSDSSTSFGVNALYNFNSNFALELAYHKYGEINESYIDDFGDSITESISSDAINAGIRGSLPLGPKFNLNAHAGLAFWNYEAALTDSSIPNTALKMDDGNNDFYFGLGLDYQISDKLSVGADYTVTEMGVTINNISGVSIDPIQLDHEVTNLSLTLRYSL